MDSVSPVLTTAELPSEQVIALGQEQYFPIVVARVWCESADPGNCDAPDPVSYTRFRFTDAERAQIAAGADLILGQPHHGPMMPVSLGLAMPGEYPKEGQ